MRKATEVVAVKLMEMQSRRSGTMGWLVPVTLLLAIPCLAVAEDDSDTAASMRLAISEKDDQKLAEIVRHSNIQGSVIDGKQWFRAARLLEATKHHALASKAYFCVCLDEQNESWLTDAQRQKLAERCLALLIQANDLESAVTRLSQIPAAANWFSQDWRLAWRLRIGDLAYVRQQSTLAISQYRFVIENPSRPADLNRQVHAAAGLRKSCVRASHDDVGTVDVLVETWALSKPGPTDAVAWLDDVAPNIAERLVTSMLRKQVASPDQWIPIREAAAAWAGQSGRWHLIALAAEPDLQSGAPHRSARLERLVAESWMQIGKLDRSLPWWRYLADVRQVDDFPTLLRTCEAEVAGGNDLAVARRRIEAAIVALDTDTDDSVDSANSNADQSAAKLATRRKRRQNLLRLVEAQWCIRAAKLDRCREILAMVVRGDVGDPPLAPRAQWLTGESFFLQRRYQDAIRAYRGVEAIDADKSYVPLALVQSGKAFERLGRTREAGICYDGLVKRFAQSPQASEANRRLAALRGTGDAESTDSRRRF
ncbi:MAG: hypothetical protein AAF958_04160 [Planctomycetota bacterium]